MKKYSILFLLFAGFFIACENGGDTADPCSSKFDQASLFINLADNLIIPAYTDLQSKTDALAAASTVFSQDITIASLTSLRTTWETAYISWQSAAAYNFGPAEVELLRSSLNNYPVNVDAINTNLAANTWNLEAGDTYDKGFPALDYLLFGTGESDASILDFFQNNPIAVQYVSDIVAQIKQKVDNTASAWENGYRETFIANTGMADGSALSQIVNGINEHYENLKRNKVGIPSGVVALGIPRPESVEARFSGISLDLAKIALQANQDFFNGNTGAGLDDYLNEIDAKKGDELLSDVINNQYDLAKTELDKIEGEMRSAVEAQNEQVVEAYKAVTIQVVNLKTDMTSVLCVAITYIDNPSDSD